MISYELCKKLREAGFPQNGENESGDYFDRNFEEEYKNSNDKANRKFWIYCPTLSELIEACGKKFGSLNLNTDGTFSYDTVRIPHFYLWVAQDESQLIDGEGDTPETAVAKLWLELNKENDDKNQSPLL